MFPLEIVNIGFWLGFSVSLGVWASIKAIELGQDFWLWLKRPMK